MNNATPEQALAVTTVFWDIKRFPVPPGFDAGRVGPCIRRLLERHGYSGPLTITAIGILSDVHDDILGALSSTGITLYYHPFASTNILAFMSRWISENPPPANILGICNPGVFPRKPPSGFNLLWPFLYSSPQEDAKSWISLILAESAGLEENTCSQTGESASWICSICDDLCGRGFESYTKHISSREHLHERLDWLPYDNFIRKDKLEGEDGNTPTMVRKQPKMATPEEAVAVTLVFWDIVMFPIPRGFDARQVCSCIRRFLEKYGYYGPLTINAVGILNDLSSATLLALSSTGINLYHTHSSTDIMSFMSRWISKNPPPANILGICNPRGFLLPPSGYNIFRPFSYSSPQEDYSLWMTFFMKESVALAGDPCSETDKPASYFCLLCNDLRGLGFESFFTHLSSYEHEHKVKLLREQN